MKTAGHPFEVVWGREKTSDYSFSAAVVAVSVLILYTTSANALAIVEADNHK